MLTTTKGIITLRPKSTTEVLDYFQVPAPRLIPSVSMANTILELVTELRVEQSRSRRELKKSQKADDAMLLRFGGHTNECRTHTADAWGCPCGWQTKKQELERKTK